MKLAVVRTLATLLLLCVTAACDVAGGIAIRSLVWLPDGTMFYQQVDFDDNHELYRRAPDGSTTAINIGKPDHAAAGDGCSLNVIQDLFVAPSGGLGLEYRCEKHQYYAEWSQDGGFRTVAKLTGGGPAAFISGSASGLALTGDGTGDCAGVVFVKDGQFATPIAPVESAGQVYDISPRWSACGSGTVLNGARIPAIRRDGAFSAFIAGPRATTNRGPGDGYLWWWPTQSPLPIRLDNQVRGIDAIAVDPAAERVLVSYGLGPQTGVDLVDLRVNKWRRITTARASQITFSPDGQHFAYVSGSHDKLIIAKLG